jgi:MoaA/NifB/PqqE/SkfB family radical SAM enzyme
MVSLDMQAVSSARDVAESPAPPAPGSGVATGLETWLVNCLAGVHVYANLLRATGRPRESLRRVRTLFRKRRRVLQTAGSRKVVRRAGRYYDDVYAPGWPSRAFGAFVRAELRHARAGDSAPSMAILKVTRGCPLRCEHCFDGRNHSAATDRGVDALLETVRILEAEGVAQLQLTGGEPLTRLEDVLRLIEATGRRLDVRMHTSGVGLTADTARRLKAAGLNGIHLSLDHWDPERHDAFRGGRNVFRWVERAARNARDADLLVVLSLCATREFVTRANLDRYVETAKSLGASFIQILEPQAVGAYAGRDVVLGPEHIAALEAWERDVNATPRRHGFPLVAYPSARDRRVGCLCAGNRYLYLDERGRIYACPFSETPAGTLGEAPFAELTSRLPGLHCAGCASG